MEEIKEMSIKEFLDMLKNFPGDFVITVDLEGKEEDD